MFFNTVMSKLKSIGLTSNIRIFSGKYLRFKIYVRFSNRFCACLLYFIRSDRLKFIVPTLRGLMVCKLQSELNFGIICLTFYHKVIIFQGKYI